MASSAGSVATRRSSGEVFDPTAYAARRKEKLQAAAALREQRKKDQEKRESDRGTAPVVPKGPAVDYTFAPSTPKPLPSSPSTTPPAKTVDEDETAGAPSGGGPHYLKPLLRRSLTGPGPPPKDVPADSPKPSEAKPSPNSSSFAQALPPFRSPSLAAKKGSKKRPAVRSPPRSQADGEEGAAGPSSEAEVGEVPADFPGEDVENQAPAAMRLAPAQKKASPAKTALSLLKAKLRLTKPKPASALCETSPPAPALPQGGGTGAPQREALSPTWGQQGQSQAGWEERRFSGGGAEQAKKEGEAGRSSLGSKLARALGPRKKKEAAEPAGASSSLEERPVRGQPQGEARACPPPEWQPPEGEVAEGVSTRPCPDCGRTFSEAALGKHAKICRKVFGQKRRAFNVAARRLEGTEAARFVQQQAPGRGPKNGASSSSSSGRGEGPPARAGRSSEATPLKKTPLWKQQSQQLQAAIQASRQYAQAKAKGVDLASLPPPPPSENLDYVPCPHCSRKFAPQVAERHIPKCKDTVHRPKPVSKRPTQGGGQHTRAKGK